MLRAAGAVAILVFSLLAGIGHAGSGRILAVSGSIESISAQRGRVAIHVSSDGGCGKGIVWTPATGSVIDLKDSCRNDGVYSNLTLAGDGAIWWDYDSGNHVYCADVYVSSFAHPGPQGLNFCEGDEGDTYIEFAGDRSLVAVVDYTVCEADCTGGNGELLPDGDYGVEVLRYRNDRLVRLLEPKDFRAFLDARNWRVAVIEPKATLTVYDAGGKKLWSVPGVTGVSSGVIDGGTVVLHQARALRVYTPAGGGTARPLPSGAKLDGVVGGLAVYRVGSTVRLLRLRDGRDRSLVTAKGVEAAQITPAGVFYAVDMPVNGGVRGLVSFVPARDVLSKLR